MGLGGQITLHLNGRLGDLSRDIVADVQHRGGHAADDAEDQPQPEELSRLDAGNCLSPSGLKSVATDSRPGRNGNANHHHEIGQ